MQFFKSIQFRILYSRRLLLGILLSLIVQNILLTFAWAQSEILQTNIPNGEIIGVETTVFDLYLSDTFQGSVITKYTDSWMEIEDPADVVSQLKGVVRTEEIIPLFSGRIEKSREIPEVGSVKFDLRTFRIVVDLKPDFLPGKQLKTTGRLPDPNREFSMLQTVRVASSGSVDENFSSTLNHQTVAAYGKYLARLDGTIVDNQPYVLTQGLVGGVQGDYEFGTGFLQTAGQTFASSVDVLGVRVKTAEQIFADQELIRGSHFQVFVPSRARVEFFRDGRLLAVQVLDYGLQDINTSSFPDGSYDVDIVVNEDNGGVSRETRFYTKSGYLALTDKPVFDLSAGAGRDQLNILSIPVYQAGVKWRVADALQLSGSVYGTNGLTIGDTAATSFYRDNFLTTGFSASSHGNYGVYSNFTGKLLTFNYSLSFAQTLNPTQSVSDPVEIIDRRDEDLIISRLDGLSRERGSLSGTISKAVIPSVQVGLLATKNKRAPDPFFNSLIPDKQKPINDRYAYGPRLEWMILNTNRHSLRFETFYLHSDDGDDFTARLSFRVQFTPDFSGISEVRSNRNDGQTESSLINTATYDGTDRQRLGNRAVATNEVREQKNKDTNSTATGVTNNLEITHTNNYIKGNGFIRDTRGADADATLLGLQGEGAFIVSNGGEVSVSRPIEEGAALVANLESKTSNAKFDLRLNEQLVGTLVAGEQRILGIQPYKTYKVSIQPSENKEMLSFDNSSEEFTVFPGNIVKRTWKVSRVVIIIGRLVDSNGIAIKLKRIKGPKDFVATDELGNFQADLVGDEKLTVDSADVHCSIETPDVKNYSEYLIDVGDIVCN